MNKIEYDNIIAFHPGYVLKDIIDGEGMTQDELSKRLGTSAKTVSKLINGKIDLSTEMAMRLSIVFGTSIGMWLKLNQDFFEKKIEIERRISLDLQRSMADALDYDYWVTLNVVEDTNDNCRRIDELQKYFRVTDLNVLKNRDFLARLPRSVELSDSNIINANAWIQTAINFAQRTDTELFYYKKLKNALLPLRNLAAGEGDVEQMTASLASCGVAFVLLPPLNHCPVDSMIKWLNKEKAVFAMVDNRRNPGKFWTGFFDGIGYIMERKLAAAIVTGQLEGGWQKNFSRDFLIPQEDYSLFIEQQNFNQQSISNFANSIKIHPDIVRYRLQKEGRLAPNHLVI